MSDSESYHTALQAVADGVVPTYGYDVLRMIADKHAIAYFKPKRSARCFGDRSYPDRYFLLLTDEGKAALRAFGAWPK